MKTILTFLSTVATCFAFANMSFGQTQRPALGTTATFAMFTANGAVSNNPSSSTITGDIGTQVGAITLPGATVIGNIRYPNSAESIQAATDVNTLYNSLNIASCGTALSSPELGGLTLVSSSTMGSGVFCQTNAAQTTLNGTLTLSGDGIFIIKSSSVLATAANSSIVLTNGATANNVFFQVVGAANLGTASVFQGTIVASGVISAGSGASVTGRLLSTEGALNTDNTVVVAAPVISDLATSPSPVCAGSPISFTATVNNATTPYPFTLTNGTSSTMGNAGSPNFAQVLTASGSGPQTFTLTVTSNGFTTTATTSVMVTALGVFMSVKVGNWNDPTVWTCGTLPTAGSMVNLKHVVTIPGGYTALGGTVRYDAGAGISYQTGGRLRLGQ